MTEQILVSSLALFADAAVKSCLLLTAAAIAARLFRRRSPAAAHRVWVLGFAGCLLLPVVSALVPSWTLPILKAPWMNAGSGRASIDLAPQAPDTLVSHAAEESLVKETVQRRLPFSQEHAGWSSQPVDPTGYSAPPPSSVRKQAVTHESPPLARSPQTRAGVVGSWVTFACVAWLVGMVVCLARMLRERWLLGRLLATGRALDDDSWVLAGERASAVLALSRPHRLVQTVEALCPMVAGLRHPIVLVPGDAGAWDPGRRFLVLLHELAHVKRHDVLTQAFANCVSALYWFNPLSWWGLAEMRRLRESACDDLVLACGQQPADYADVLLSVARSYRQQSFVMAVGMARKSNVESRILAVLDRARSRMAMSHKMARVLLLCVTAMVLLVGSMQLRSAANPPTEPPASKPQRAKPPAAKPSTANGLRPLLVRVVDEQGAPLEDASLHIGIWYVDGYQGPKVPRDYVTDKNGYAALRIPPRLLILRMWPSKTGYVPRFVNFAQGTHDEGKLIPLAYEFQLTKGTQIGGRVVDEDGQPIVGVKVDVSVSVTEPVWGVNPRSMISTWLTDEDFNRGSAITDAQGRWSIDNAPAPKGPQDYEFRLRFTHDNYASDANWGELQRAQGLTTAMLRNKSAELVMSGGVAVAGTVVDVDGKPVTKGIVSWDADPYPGPTVLETHIDEQGGFRTLRLPPGEYPFTVVAPGHSPERRMVRVAESMDKLRFVLQPGKRLSIRFVDSQGAPVGNTSVGIVEWRSEKALYNHDHPNVPDSGIPRHSDENGLYVWDWAPPDAVAYYFSKKGYATIEATLTATEAPHVITLASELIASGRVTDASSGKSIQEFQAIPVKQFRPDFMTTLFRNQRPGEDGRYELPLADGPGSHDRYRVRIEAHGYRSVISKRSFPANAGRVAADFALHPAPARQGRVIDRRGDPVGNVAVIQASPSILPMLRNNRLEWTGQQVETSAHGTFQLRATSEPVRIRFIHASGMAEILRQPDEEIGTIQLQPWARVEGQLMQNGVPVPDQWVYFRPVLAPVLGEPRFQDSFSAQTDAEGRFTFDRLPPIPGSIRAHLGPWRESPLTSSKSVPLNLAPGERQTVTLGIGGATITGRVKAEGRGDVPLDKNWSLNYLIRRDGGGIGLPDDCPKLSFDPSGPVRPSWFLDPGHQAWLATQENYFVKLSPEGDLRICGVPAGIYDLVFRLYEQPAGCLVETVGEKVISLEVTAADVAAGAKDIGEIEVECRTGPRPRENMQAYRFTDASGRERRVQDMEGSYVLMHVWAGWCAPCRASLPQMKTAVENWAGQPVVFVGLNIDKDIDSAKSLVQENGWSWSQNYLGEDSDMARQLAISSVPTYFLIGPGGALIMSTTDWSAARAAIENKLEE